MADQKRPYQKKQRAELEAQTRRRITESTVELHRTLGPARTSISAVAERAGVRRSTVYRHFPDEAALFAACSAHWTALNPPPDITGWAGRAQRAHSNMLENLVLFAILVLVAHAVGVSTGATRLGAALYFWGRLAHAVLYIAGIPWLRTAAFGVSVVGLLLVFAALVQ